MARDIEKILEDYKEETKRHFDVVTEDLKDEIKLVAEGVDMNTERIETNTKKIDSLQKDMNEVKGTLQTIKLDIEFIKHDLKKKVDRDEFAALERRVSLLEAKASPG